MQVQRASRWYFGLTAVAVVIVFFITFWSPQLPAQEQYVWRVQPRFKFNGGGKERSLASKTVNVQLTIDGTDIELELIENELLMTDPPVFITRDDGRIARVYLDNEGMQKPRYMQDEKGRAAVMLRKNVTQQHGSAYEIEGIIFNGNDTYQISPIRNATHETNSGMEFSHELKRIPPEEATEHELRAAIKRSSQEIQQDLLRGTPRVRRDTFPPYEVQLLYVLDYSIYKKFRDGLARDIKGIKKSIVLRAMLHYFAQVSNVVDLRYQSISTAPFTIRTKLTSIYIVTKATSSNWTESTEVEYAEVISRTHRKTVQADAVLTAFIDWIYGESGAVVRSSLPTFDHAVLYTRYDLYFPSKRAYLLGVARGGSICTSQSASVVRHVNGMLDAETCAHELGHSLGAQHDGINNSCNDSMQYIMTATADLRTKETFLNQFIFSNCSIDYFANLIFLENNCLTDTEQRVYPSRLQWHLAAAPGQTFNHNILCMEYFGYSYRACGGTEFGSRICEELRCYNASGPVFTNDSCPFLGARVLDGTSCGNKRWCQGGKCVYHSSAPEAFDDCPIGDLADNFQVRADQPFVCSNMPTSYCYSPDIYSACCDRCNTMKDLTRPGCEYGDRDGSDNCTLPML